MSTLPHFAAFFSMPQGTELLIILAIGLLLFGRKLPEVGRSLGRSIVEFKKGIKGIEDDIDRESSTTTASSPRLSSRPAADSSQPAGEASRSASAAQHEGS